MRMLLVFMLSVSLLPSFLNKTANNNYKNYTYKSEKYQRDERVLKSFKEKLTTAEFVRLIKSLREED